jgi:hypothetical protein
MCNRRKLDSSLYHVKSLTQNGSKRQRAKLVKLLEENLRVNCHGYNTFKVGRKKRDKLVEFKIKIFCA